MHPISVVIDTFSARADVADSFVAGFERVRGRLVEPLLAVHGRLHAWFEVQPTFELGPPGDASWSRLGELIRGGHTIYASVEIRGDSRSAGYFHFGVRLAHELVSGAPHTITMHAHPTLFAGVPEFHLTREIEALAKELAVSTRASAGYVACHLSLSRDADEQRGGDTTPGADRDLRIQLRGAYWGNLLSGGHVAALGGREHLLATCPADVLEDLTQDGHELVYAGLRDTPLDDHGQTLLELERYLRPVLEPLEEPEAPLLLETA